MEMNVYEEHWTEWSKMYSNLLYSLWQRTWDQVRMKNWAWLVIGGALTIEVWLNVTMFCFVLFFYHLIWLILLSLGHTSTILLQRWLLLFIFFLHLFNTNLLGGDGRGNGERWLALYSLLAGLKQLVDTYSLEWCCRYSASVSVLPVEVVGSAHWWNGVVKVTHLNVLDLCMESQCTPELIPHQGCPLAKGNLACQKSFLT